jgi:DNA-binding CsgD family transcriptional regulator
MAPGISDSKPRVFGYRDELARVSAALAEPASRGCMVIGATGMGKTTLMNAAVAALDRSVPVLRFRGSESTFERDLGVFEVLLTRTGHSGPFAPGVALSVIRRSLEATYPVTLPIALVDNANRIDPHSLSVVAQLAEAGKIRVLLGAPNTRPPVDLVSQLWMTGLMSRVDLEGLDEKSVSEMVRAVGRPVEQQRTTAELCAISGGNPRLLSRLLQGGLRAGANHGLGRSIEPRHRTVLEIVAAARAVPYDGLLRLATTEQIDELVEKSLLRMSGGRPTTVTMAEPLVAESLRSGFLPSRRLELWKEVTAVVDIAELEELSLLGFVEWGQSLGITLPVERVLAAGMWANASGRRSEAARVLRGSRHEDDELLLELIRAERGQDDLDAARRLVGHLVERAIDPAGLPRTRTPSKDYLSRLACIDLGLSDPRRPEDLSTAWIRDRVSHSEQAGRLDVTRAQYEIKAGRLDSGRELANAVYRDHRCLNRHRLRACAMLGVADVMSGRITRGFDYLHQAESMFELPGSTSHEFEAARAQLFVGRYIGGDWERAAASVDGLASAQQLSLLVHALIDLRTGHVSRARTSLEELRRSARAVGFVGLEPTSRAALDYANRVLATDPGPDRDRSPVEWGADSPEYSWWAEFEAQLLSLQALALRRPGSAARRLDDLGRRAADVGAHALAATAWIESVRFGHGPAGEALADASTRVDGTLGRLAAAVARAHRHQTVEAVVGASREALAFGNVALCADLARSARASAARTGNTKYAKEARLLLDGSMRTIRFSDSGARMRELLTEVERQVVDGVVQGRSSAELGAALHLSTRTVEWHLTRVYRRLHVSNRRDLREIARAWGRR